MSKYKHCTVTEQLMSLWWWCTHIG